MAFAGDNMMGVKRTNRSAALRILHRYGPMSRKHLAEGIRLTPAAITKIVSEMIGEGLLQEGNPISGGGAGRREVLLELNPHAGCALGTLINLRQAIISAVWLDGTVIFSEELELPPAADGESVIEMLSGKLLTRATEYALKDIVGLGIAVRGITGMDERSVASSFGALAQSDFPLCQRMEALTGYKSVLSNHVRALLTAQRFLSRDDGEGAQFFLQCDYDIGAALSIQDKIWHGVTKQCAEIGHIPVIRNGGKPCSCGKSGCLETVASLAALVEDARAILSPEITPILWKLCDGNREYLELTHILTAAREGDTGAAELVDRSIAALAGALQAVIYLIDPGKIVLYGRLFEEPDYVSRLLNEILAGIDKRHTVSIEKSEYNCRLEDKAAGILAVEDFFARGGVRMD